MSNDDKTTGSPTGADSLDRSVRHIPCPFCGCSDKVHIWQVDRPQSGVRVGCLNPECDINPFTRTIWATPHDAWKSWNRRVFVCSPNVQDMPRRQTTNTGGTSE
jgi:hypothetical protein